MASYRSALCGRTGSRGFRQLGETRVCVSAKACVHRHREQQRAAAEDPYWRQGPGGGGIRQDEWEGFCAGNGLTQGTPGGDTWYDARQQIQVIRRGRRHTSFATARTGGLVPEVARLAVTCWARFGGRLTASPEIAGVISDAVQTAQAGLPAKAGGT